MNDTDGGGMNRCRTGVHAWGATVMKWKQAWRTNGLGRWTADRSQGWPWSAEIVCNSWLHVAYRWHVLRDCDIYDHPLVLFVHAPVYESCPPPWGTTRPFMFHLYLRWVSIPPQEWRSIKQPLITSLFLWFSSSCWDSQGTIRPRKNRHAK